MKLILLYWLSLFRRHHYRWRASKFVLLLAFMDIHEQWVFFSFPHYFDTGHTFQGPVTLKLVQTILRQKNFSSLIFSQNFNFFSIWEKFTTIKNSQINVFIKTRIFSSLNVSILKNFSQKYKMAAVHRRVRRNRRYRRALPIPRVFPDGWILWDIPMELSFIFIFMKNYDMVWSATQRGTWHSRRSCPSCSVSDFWQQERVISW